MDFPSTPSAVYSKRLLANAEGRFDQDIGQVQLDGDNKYNEDVLASHQHHVSLLTPNYHKSRNIYYHQVIKYIKFHQAILFIFNHDIN